MTNQRPPVNVGVDVSKDTLDVHLLERDLSLSIPNREPEIVSLIRSSTPRGTDYGDTVNRPVRREHLDRRSTRARLALSPTDRFSHRCRSLQPRQWQLPRQAAHSRRSGPLAHRALPQRHGRDPLQPRHQTLLRTTAPNRQTQEGRAHRLHPQNRHRSQRHAA